VPAALYVAGAALAVGIVWLTAPVHPGLRLIGSETADLLAWRDGPMSFQDGMVFLPLLVGSLSLAGIVAGTYVLFRPLSALAAPPDADERRAARRLVRAHGADTLAYFKLRTDLHYLFSTDRRAFVGYRVQGGVMIIAGDPIGATDALPDVMRAAIDFAEAHGLRLAALGAGQLGLQLYRQAGLRSLYIGDEAIVDTSRFSLEGRPIRKVRQSVTRLCKAGYEVRVYRLGSLDQATLAALACVWADGRGEAPERGFAMALDSVGGEHQADSVVVAAHDADGRIRGFLHFVPAYGLPAMSLSCMRRERDSPNGLTEFLVVRSIELLGERGVEELSLNFAAFARIMQDPQNVRDRVLGRALALANPFFQIESLYRFNAKFFPRWEPRYLMYESVLGLPRVGLVALLAEGQLSGPRRAPAPVRA